MSENIQAKPNKQPGKVGGARLGSGRKLGSATKKTREIADRAMESGISPLEYMLQVMRTDIPLDFEPREAVAAVTLRFEAAKAAAPYMHPRLQAIEHTGADGGSIDHSMTVRFVGAK